MICLIDYVRFASILCKNRKFEDAKKHLEYVERALQEDNQAQRLRFEIANLYARMKCHDKAILLYQQVLQAWPDSVNAHVNIAAQQMVIGQLEGALEHCERALLSDITCREGHYNLNVVLRRLGRQKEAIERCWRCIEKELGFFIRPCFAIEVESTCIPTSVSILCVKWGTKYGPEYVNRLYKAVERSTDVCKFEFYCLTDDSDGIDERVVALPLTEKLTGWWNKALLFDRHISAQLKLEHCVYLDLDTVIVANIDSILQHSTSSLGILKTDQMRNEARVGGYNSSVMIWNTRSSDLEQLSTLLLRHFEIIFRYIYKFDHWLEMMVSQPDILQDALPGSFVEYKSLDESSPKLPTNASLVCFPLHPKPHDADASWIKDFWHD